MRTSTFGATAVCLLAGVLLAAGPARRDIPSSSPAQDGLKRAPGDRHVLVALPYRAGTRVGVPRDRTARLTPQNAATVNVTYVGFGAFPAAQAAFQHAVNIWQSQITSSVPITVRAEFAPLDPGILGSAGPTQIFANFPGAPQLDVFYPVALANKLRGIDLNTGQVDIVAQFSSSFSNWYFGTDGNPAFNQYDFVSVVLHELGHGLGFVGSMSVSAGSGSWGAVVNGTPYPITYDTFAVNGSAQSLINLSLFPNPSTSLATQLQSNNIFWNGTAGRSANSGNRPKLYAPAAWSQGSSYSHLDEVAFPAGNPNSLMTYALAQDEAIHSPGPITLGMFQDMGWGAAPTPCTYSISPTTASVPADGATGLVTVTTQAGCGWSAISNSSFVSVTSAASGSGSGTVAYSVAQNTNAARSATITIAGNVFTINQAAACTYSISPSSASLPVAGGGGSVGVTTQTGCAWAAASNNSFITINSPTTSVSGSGTVSYSVAANGVSHRTGSMTIAGRTFSVSQLGSGPTMSLNRSALNFGAVTNDTSFTARTQAQTVRMTQSGAGAVTWTASSNRSWLVVSPTSGTGAATFTISVLRDANVPIDGMTVGAISLNLTGAGNAVAPISVTLRTYFGSRSAAPFGSFDTPANDTTGVTGSLAVTGWALDDVQVDTVGIWRDAVTGEAPGLRFIGHATFVDGARSDLFVPYASFPLHTRGGWGYMMLTNMLPNRGNGTFVLHAVATDREGRQTLLGSKTITCTNATATRPFGAIDTPMQGQVVSGTNFDNFGWVLSPGTARADVPGGGTVTVYIDGVPVGTPTGWTSRPDLSALFPKAEYDGIDNALAVYSFNPSTLTDGVHTIAWVVFDNMGQGAGVGSRYFTVSGGTALTAASTGALTHSLADDVLATPRDNRPILARRGYDLFAPYRTFMSDGQRITIHGEEIDRLELQLAPSSTDAQLTGHLRVGSDLRPLPIGSNLNTASGVFTWQPGVGFLGTYDLVFVRWADGRAVSRQDVRIILNPQGSGRVGPQVVIDLPAAKLARNFSSAPALAPVTQPFIVAGWAADLDAWSGTGIATLHVWAYPAGGGAPLFLGATAYGGMRPDVGAVYGDQFTASGYSLTVRNLPQGEYMLAVFGYSLVQHGFVPAKTVWVTVR